MYLDELISEIRWDRREEFDRFIHVLMLSIKQKQLQIKSF